MTFVLKLAPMTCPLKLNADATQKWNLIIGNEASEGEDYQQKNAKKRLAFRKHEQVV